jgi:hypothetical protein
MADNSYKNLKSVHLNLLPFGKLTQGKLLEKIMKMNVKDVHYSIIHNKLKLETI